ncbi:MAG: cyclic nucleotide-binding domain-containing protein [Myxococcota bacterium]
MLGESALDRVRDRLLLLRSMEAFAGLDDSGYALLAEHTRARFFKKGARLLEAGQPVERLYVVTSGAVRMSSGEQIASGALEPRGVGVLSFYARDPQGVEAVALEATHTLEIPAHVLLGALETNFSLVRSALRALATQRAANRNGRPPVGAGGDAEVVGSHGRRPPTLVERILELHDGVLFRQCNLDAVIEACRQMRLARWERGERLWSRGERATTWVRFADGQVLCDGERGQESRVGAGFALGIDDALGTGVRSFGATALTEVHGFEMSSDAFLILLSAHFDVARELLALFASDLLRQGEPPAPDQP